MPLGIAFLDSWHADPGRGSGSAVAIGGLADALRAQGHEVVVHAPSRRSGRALPRLAFNVALRRRLRPASHDLVVGFDLDGCLLPSWEGPPVRVASLKGVMADEMRFERGTTRLRFALLSRLERRNARRADCVVVTSRYSAGRAIEAYGLDPGRVEVVPEGIDLARWREGSGPTGATRARPGGAGRPPTILSVARQYPRKDTRSLIAAMPAVRASVPDARLRVVGGGPELPALRRLADRLRLGRAVELAGEVGDRRAVRDAYGAADVFALPSLQEGFGIVFLEAMAAGLPVVAARAGAAPEVVPEERAGLLVPPRDPEALGAALVRLLTDAGLRTRLGAGGREHVRQFDWPLVARRFLEAAGA